MSEMEKNPVTPTGEDTPEEVTGAEEVQETIAGKIKKLFSVQSPYADYAADNDRVSEMMYETDAEPPKPTVKDLLRTVFSALLLVLVFMGVALMFSMASTCLGSK